MERRFRRFLGIMYIREQWINKDTVLKALNDSLYKEVYDKYASGSISHWEMESISFYSHEHELACAAHNYDDFFSLPEEPEVEYTFTFIKLLGQ